MLNHFHLLLIHTHGLVLYGLSGLALGGYDAGVFANEVDDGDGSGEEGGGDFFVGDLAFDHVELGFGELAEGFGAVVGFAEEEFGYLLDGL